MLIALREMDEVLCPPSSMLKPGILNEKLEVRCDR